MSSLTMCADPSQKFIPPVPGWKLKIALYESSFVQFIRQTGMMSVAVELAGFVSPLNELPWMHMPLFP